jgi:ABC-2 type transport system ATP-binding protein
MQWLKGDNLSAPRNGLDWPVAFTSCLTSMSASTRQPMIVVERLTKTFRVPERATSMGGRVRSLFFRRYRTVEAVKDTSFTLAEGELLGLIGPNGAGKSTTIKILCGILEPTSGRCEVGGLVPWRERVRHVARIGAVFGQRTQLWWDLPVVESFELLRDIYRVSPERYRRTSDELIALLDLERLLSTPVRQLSLGQRMRCEIAASMLHEPRVLFLDEPTIGLDAVGKLAVRNFVRTLNREQGVTVILTTHDMQDIEALAERVIVIGRGTILADGSLGSLRRGALAERRLWVHFVGEPAEVKLPGATVRQQQGRSVELAFDPRTMSAHRLIASVAAQFEVEDVHLEEPPIEEVIARFYEQHSVEA